MPKKRKTKRKRATKSRAKNPKTMLFSSKAAARKYVKEHKNPKYRFSIKKMKRVR